MKDETKGRREGKGREKKQRKKESYKCQPNMNYKQNYKFEMEANERVARTEETHPHLCLSAGSQTTTGSRVTSGGTGVLTG